MKYRAQKTFSAVARCGYIQISKKRDDRFKTLFELCFNMKLPSMNLCIQYINHILRAFNKKTVQCSPVDYVLNVKYK